MEKILIISPAWVGDSVMAQTLFKRLKQQHPNSIIDVLTPKACADVFQFMPEVNDIIINPFGHGDFKFWARRAFAKTLIPKNYDTAFVLPNSWKSALIPYFAGISRRIGFLGELRYGLLNRWIKLDKQKLKLMIERFAALSFDSTNQLPYPQFNLKDVPPKAEKPIIALCPGAEYGPAKRWPIEYFAEVAKTKINEGYQVWIFGGPKEKPLGEEISALVNHPECNDLTGKTTLAEAIKLMNEVDVVVTNDSGLMHIACALDKKVIAIYGSSDTKFTPPLSDKAKCLTLNLACSPCFQRECPLGHLNCLKQLTPEQVLCAF